MKDDLETKFYLDDPDCFEPEPPRRRRHGFLRFLLTLILIAAILAAAVLVYAKQPKTELPGARRALVSTVLIAGADEGGLRTDTMMLLTVDAAAGVLRMTSIPRDTLTNGTWNVPKLNSAYGVYGGGAEGMEGVIKHLTDVIGFRPDGYAVVELDAFIEAVDLMGGVEFDVPQDMYYYDPTQDLLIDLKAGHQRLDWNAAMGLVRFRSGYAAADITRVSVQRDFISAALSQWLTVKNVGKVPGLMRLIKDKVVTDLDTRELVWLALALARCGTDDAGSAVIPGSGAMIGGAAYYVVDEEGTLALLNSGVSPLKRDLTPADLHINKG
jgi:LCP family protein required for cell wall assembly